MMGIIELHPEVVKFLTEHGTVYHYEDGAHGFEVNGIAYSSTDIEGKYTIQYTDIQLDGNN